MRSRGRTKCARGHEQTLPEHFAFGPRTPSCSLSGAIGPVGLGAGPGRSACILPPLEQTHHACPHEVVEAEPAPRHSENDGMFILTNKNPRRRHGTDKIPGIRRIRGVMWRQPWTWFHSPLPGSAHRDGEGLMGRFARLVEILMLIADTDPEVTRFIFPNCSRMLIYAI